MYYITTVRHHYFFSVLWMFSKYRCIELFFHVITCDQKSDYLKTNWKIYIKLYTCQLGLCTSLMRGPTLKQCCQQFENKLCINFNEFLKLLNFVDAGFHPSPWSSPYSSGSSPSRIPLWTSGYELDTSMRKRSPNNRSPYQ